MLQRALLVFLLLLLILVGVDIARQRLERSDRYVLEEVFLGATWADPISRQRFLVGDESVLPPRASLMTPSLEEDLRAHLTQRPWVKGVPEVNKFFPNAVKLRVELRSPVAWRMSPDGDILLDEEGVFLRPLGLEPSLPEVVVSSGEPSQIPAEGSPFVAGPEQEAAALLKALQPFGDHPALETLRVARVVVGDGRGARRVGDSDLFLEFERGLRVRWGRAPGSPLAPVEPPVEQKLDNLASVMAEFPGLLGVSVVDLRFREAEIELEQGNR